MLSVHEVTTAYQGLVAISAVSIEVAKGEIVCVAGANGAGKSTLLKSIAGAERPRSGTVSFDGSRIDGMAQHVITSRGIAYVPENRRLFPRLSVRDNLRLGSYLFRGQNNRFFKREHLEKTQAFYERYGGKTIIIARFVPIVRTFAPFLAGVGQMNYRHFAMFNITGAVAWVVLGVYAGYLFGTREVVKENFSLVIIAIVAISLLPAAIEYWRARRSKAPAAKESPSLEGRG